jgi:hypothetical protein
MFIAKMQKERFVAFPRQNGYVKAPLCYFISTLPILFRFFKLCMELWLALCINLHPLTPGFLQDAYFLKIYVFALIYSHSAILLLPYYNNHSLLPPMTILVSYSYTQSTPVRAAFCWIYLSVCSRLRNIFLTSRFSPNWTFNSVYSRQTTRSASSPALEHSGFPRVSPYKRSHCK